MNLGLKSVHSKNQRVEILRAIEAGEAAVHLDDFLFNAVRDLDGDVIRDLDGDPVYENGAIRDNPLTPTRVFQTVAELLAYDAKRIDAAITLNWESGDGNMQEWQMIADPSLAENGTDILESDDGYGFYRTFSTRGPDADDNFATLKDLAALNINSRYTHSQGSPSAVWTVNHNLGFRPRVAVEDLFGQAMLVDAQNVGNGFSTIELRFGSPTTGLAYLG